MPVQINELIIRATIVETPDKETQAEATRSADWNREEIIRECTEAVLEIINNQNER